MVRVTEGYHLILTEEGINVDVPFDMDGFIDVVAGEVPGSRKPLKEYMKLCQEIGRAIDYIAEADGKPDPMVLMRDHKTLLATAGYTAQKVTDSFHLPKKALSILGVFWPYIAIPFNRMSFTIWATAINSVLTRGCYVPTMTSHQISTALDRKINDLGGQTEYNTRVEKILVEGGRVVGVETSRGERIRTDWIISNSSPNNVYGRLIHPQEEVPRGARKLTSARRLGISLMCVYLGLDRPAHELKLDHHEYYFAPDMDIQRAYDLGNTLVPHTDTSALCPNNVIADASPPGTCELILNQSYGPEVWGEVKAEEYIDTKRRFAEAAIGRVAQALGSDLADHIEEIEIAAPQTFCRYTGSFKGVVYGYEQDAWQAALHNVGSRGKCKPPTRDLDQQRVVVGGDLGPGEAVAGVEPDPGAAGGAVGLDGAEVGGEAVLRVLGGDAALDGEAAHLDVGLGGDADLRVGEPVPLGHQDLRLHQVPPGDHLGDGVLHLDARVHLDEVVAPLLVEEELDGAGVAVGTSAARCGGRPRRARPLLRGERQRGGELDHLLVAALHRAVALEEVDQVAVGVAQHLDLDVLGVLDVALQEDGRVAEGGLGLAAGPDEPLEQLLLAAGHPHAAPAAAGRRP